MISKFSVFFCLALFALVASFDEQRHVSDASAYLLDRTEQLLKYMYTENALIKPNVSGNLMTRIRQLAKEIRRKTDEYKATPIYDEFVPFTKLQLANKVFEEQNSIVQLLDLLKLIQKHEQLSAFQYAQMLSKEMHQIEDDKTFKRELKELDDTINQKHPDYMEWYHESKVIDRTLSLLEIKFSIQKK